MNLKKYEELRKKAESGDAQAMLEYSEYLQKYHGLQEAYEWQRKTDIYRRITSQCAVIDNHPLQRWHQGAANDSHYEECRTNGRILLSDIFKGDTID